MITFDGKIPIRIHPLFFLMAAIIGFINTENFFGAFIWIGVIMVSVLIHELGHAFTAIFFGQKVRIDFVALGGITSRSSEDEIKLWQEFLVVLNGPLAGLGLAFLCMFLLPAFNPHSLFYAFLEVGMYVNFFWTFANLLPIQPLDGGHLLRIVLEGIFGVQGVKISILLSLFFSVAAAGLFFMLGAMLPGVLFCLFAFEGWRIWQMSHTMTATDRMGQYRKLLREAEKSLLRGEWEKGLEQLEMVRQQTKEGLTYLAATQQMAKIFYQNKNYEEVYKLLLPLSKELDPEVRYILYDAAYHTRQWDLVVRLGNDIYTIFPSDWCALINAEAHAALGEVEAAVGWLDCAISDGASDIASFIKRGGFDRIRDEPDFRRWQESQQP